MRLSHGAAPGAEVFMELRGGGGDEYYYSRVTVLARRLGVSSFSDVLLLELLLISTVK